MASQHVISAIVPVFLVMALGLGLRRIKVLTAEADASIFRLTINILIPCLILDSVVGNELLNSPGNLLVAPGVGFLTLVGGILLARLLSPLAGLRQIKERRTFAVASGVYNWAYLPLPICVALFGQDTVGVLFVHNLGVEIALWSVGILVLTGGGGMGALRRLLNPPVLAIVGAVLLNLMHARSWVPPGFFDAVRIVGMSAIPIGLILVGASFADHMTHLRWKDSWRPGLAGCILRLGLMPPAFLALAVLLPVSPELKQVIVVQAAMPSAVFPLIMALHYGGDPGTALRVIVSTSLLGIITIPLWIGLGLSLIS